MLQKNIAQGRLLGLAAEIRSECDRRSLTVRDYFSLLFFFSFFGRRTKYCLCFISYRLLLFRSAVFKMEERFISLFLKAVRRFLACAEDFLHGLEVNLGLLSVLISWRVAIYNYIQNTSYYIFHNCSSYTIIIAVYSSNPRRSRQGGLNDRLLHKSGPLRCIQYSKHTNLTLKLNNTYLPDKKVSRKHILTIPDFYYCL